MVIVALALRHSRSNAEADCPAESGSPAIVTDAPNYFPEQLPQIDGCGFQAYAGTSLSIAVTRPDRQVDKSKVTPDSDGQFTYTYQLDGILGVYLVQVYDPQKAAIASVTFEDARVNLDQCADGAPVFKDRHCDWQNGDLNSENSHYGEGDKIPYRLFIQNLDPKVSHTIHINYDFTRGGEKAFDFLAMWNVTQNGADPCAGSAGVPKPCPPGPASTFPFPGDAFNPGNKGSLTVDGAIADASISRDLTIYNGTITSISAVSHSGNVNGNSTADLLVTFKANACGKKSCKSTVLLLWSGHLAKGFYWGTGNGASGISGTSLHMRTQNLDISGAANQSRSVHASALAPQTPTGTPKSPTATATRTATRTPTPKNTPTATLKKPTSTPNKTATSTPEPPTPTLTAKPPTSTSTATETPLPSDTPTDVPNDTPEPSATPKPPATQTPDSTATAIAGETTATPTPTPGPESTVAPAEALLAVNGTLSAGGISLSVPSKIVIPLNPGATNTADISVSIVADVPWVLNVRDLKSTDIGFMTSAGQPPQRLSQSLLTVFGSTEVDLSAGGTLATGEGNAKIPAIFKQHVDIGDLPGAYSIDVMFEAVAGF